MKKIVIIICLIILISFFLLNSDKAKLIRSGCATIQIDVDGNTCSLNEEGTDYNVGCTEMLTTQKLDKPICVNYE